MKTLFSISNGLKILTIILSLFCNISYAQDKETWEDVTVFEFSSPYQKMTVNFDDEEFYFLVTNDTKFLKKKKKAVKAKAKEEKKKAKAKAGKKAAAKKKVKKKEKKKKDKKKKGKGKKKK